MAASDKINLLNLDRKAMEAWFVGLGHKAFHGRNALKWIHKHGVTDFGAMTDLSKPLRAQLQELAEIRVPEIVYEQPSLDGTRKWVLELDCNNRIETVMIPDGERTTLCVSSQVGCGFGCGLGCGLGPGLGPGPGPGQRPVRRSVGVNTR